MTKFKQVLAVATAFAAVGLAGAASAQVTGSFVANPSGNAGPGAGYTTVQNFNSCTSSSCAGVSGAYQIYTGNITNFGAVPNNSGTPYLAVLANNSATYTFATPTTAVRFDWGTASNDNILTVNYLLNGQAGAYTYTVPNSEIPGGSSYNANGIFTATATAGATITSLTFAAKSNSFEIDNIATAAVPEPATWGMMILGFGLIGSLARRRKTVLRFA